MGIHLLNFHYSPRNLENWLIDYPKYHLVPMTSTRLSTPTPKVDICKLSWRKEYSIARQRLCPNCDRIIGGLIVSRSCVYKIGGSLCPSTRSYD